MSKRIISYALCLLLAMPLFTGCSKSTTADEVYTANGFYFDTVISISIYDEVKESEKKEAADACLSLCTKYENLLSATIEGSDVAKINEAGGAPVTISDETASLIEKALEISNLSDGLFDISIAPVVDLWDITGDNPHVPDDASIQSALSHVNYQNIKLDGNTVTLLDPEMKIDLGAIAKGFIADRLKECLEEHNISHGLINLGGNVLAFGGKADNSDFTIGLQKPFDEHGDAIASVRVKDASVVTSGSYERYFEENDHLYHHIMDTTTGYPVDNGLSAVTILSENSETGDALSTACFSLGKDKGMELIDSMPDIYAIFITTDNEIFYSKGLREAYSVTEN